tara:strand:- start:302 stop:844 length:543 start_codon:yes stop_codon:yes gene_type:complete
MFKNPFQVAITFAIIALIVKLAAFSMGIQHGEMEKYIFYIYILLLLLTVFMGIRSNKIMNEASTSLGQDFKSGARSASIFAILVTTITYLYYSNIDPEFFIIKKADYLVTLPNKINLAIQGGEMTIEQIKVKAIGDIQSTNIIFSPYLHSMATMFGLVFIGLFQSIVFAFLMKKSAGLKK